MSKEHKKQKKRAKHKRKREHRKARVSHGPLQGNQLRLAQAIAADLQLELGPWQTLFAPPSQEILKADGDLA